MSNPLSNIQWMNVYGTNLLLRHLLIITRCIKSSMDDRMTFNCINVHFRFKLIFAAFKRANIGQILFWSFTSRFVNYKVCFFSHFSKICDMFILIFRKYTPFLLNISIDGVCNNSVQNVLYLTFTAVDLYSTRIFMVPLVLQQTVQSWITWAQ